jgi:hypothetical protein
MHAHMGCSVSFCSSTQQAMLRMRSLQLKKLNHVMRQSGSSPDAKLTASTLFLSTVEDKPKCRRYQRYPSAVIDAEEGLPQEGTLKDCLQEILSAQMELKAILSCSARVKEVPVELCDARDAVEQGEGRAGQILNSQDEASDLEMIRETFTGVLLHMDLMMECKAYDERDKASSGADTHEHVRHRPGLPGACGNSFRAFRNVFVDVVSELLKRCKMQEETLRTLRADAAGKSPESAHALLQGRTIE